VGVESLGPDRSWRPLYLAGAVAALLYVVLVVVPVTLVFAAPVPPSEGQAVLEYIATHKVVYLTELICFVGLGVPAFYFSLTAAGITGQGIYGVGGTRWFGASANVLPFLPC